MGFLDKLKGTAKQAANPMGQGAQRDKIMKINQSGVEGRATVNSMQETGTQFGGGHQIDFDLTVHPAGRRRRLQRPALAVPARRHAPGDRGGQGRDRQDRPGRPGVAARVGRRRRRLKTPALVAATAALVCAGAVVGCGGDLKTWRIPSEAMAPTLKLGATVQSDPSRRRPARAARCLSSTGRCRPGDGPNLREPDRGPATSTAVWRASRQHLDSGVHQAGRRDAGGPHRPQGRRRAPQRNSGARAVHRVVWARPGRLHVPASGRPPSWHVFRARRQPGCLG